LKGAAMSETDLRDDFAKHVISNIRCTTWTWDDIGLNPVNGKTIIENEAIFAYKVADAMMAARKSYPESEAIQILKKVLHCAENQYDDLNTILNTDNSIVDDIKSLLKRTK